MAIENNSIAATWRRVKDIYASPALFIEGYDPAQPVAGTLPYTLFLQSHQTSFYPKVLTQTCDFYQCYLRSHRSSKVCSRCSELRVLRRARTRLDFTMTISRAGRRSLLMTTCHAITTDVLCSLHQLAVRIGHYNKTYIMSQLTRM